MNFFRIVLCCVFFISCNSNKISVRDLENTKWFCKIAEGCYSSYHFNVNNIYEHHSCEQEQIYYGKYYVQNDTLYLDENCFHLEEEENIDDCGRLRRVLFKIILKNNKLKRLSISDYENGKWVKSKFKFDESFKYAKYNNIDDFVSENDDLDVSN